MLLHHQMISELLQTAFATMMNYFYRPEANSHEEPMTSVHTPWDWVTQEAFRRAVVKAQGIPHCFEDRSDMQTMLQLIVFQTTRGTFGGNFEQQ